MSSDNILVRLHNCRILRDHRIYTDDLWVRNGKIMNPEPIFYVEKVYEDARIDCHNAIIAPGFIDVQINGGFGVNFTSPSDFFAKGVQTVAKEILSHGVTSFCPTIITSPSSLYKKVLPQIRVTEGNKDGAGILGIHLEGPFINPEKKGAHADEYICNYDNGFQDILEMYKTLDNVCLVTLAPELKNSHEVIKKFVNMGITVSLGHSMADLAIGEEAVDHGATFITHLFNAMLPFHHRDPGLVGLLTIDANLPGTTIFYGIIADGIHTHPAALRIAHRTNPNGLVLITDAISAMGLPTGVHHIGSKDIEIKDNRAVLAGTEILCGSIATMNKCIKYFYEATECTQVEALESASLHPAQGLGISNRKGSLDFNTDADFVMLDDNLNVLSTFIAGKCVYENPDVIPYDITIVEKPALSRGSGDGQHHI